MAIDRQKIKSLREKLGLSQADAATAAGLTNRQQWNQIETGERDNATVATLEKMAKALGRPGEGFAQMKSEGSPLDIDAWDKRKAAIHEAAHLTVAMAEGARCGAWIWKKAGDYNVSSEVGWVGRCRMIGGTPSGATACAGAIGEAWADDGGDIADLNVLDLDVVIEPSETDQNYIPDNEDRIVACQVAIKMLAMHRKFFEWAIAELIQHQTVTDSQAKKVFAEYLICAAGEVQEQVQGKKGRKKKRAAV